MKYVIHAYEHSYGGLHGIEDWRATEWGCMSDAEQEAIEMSIGVMESYSFIEEALNEQACFYTGYDSEDILDEEQEEEWNSALEDVTYENVAYTIWEVNEECELSILEINRLLAKDPDGFVDEYCRIAVGC